ncbi:MAG: sulfotransferase [Planctomycetes bacterium]|nr:sulfotransferase [Planctomycetota bacterium]
MKETIKNIANIFDLIKNYFPSLYGGFKNSSLFNNIETYCMFIGYPRSGHSLIGALLDAHPNVIIAHELGTLKYILAKYSKKQIFYLLLNNSQFYAKHNKAKGGYLNIVPRQWNGKHKILKVIGDKHGEGAVLRLRKRPWLLSQLRKTVRTRLRFIHIIRNPYDTISTIYKKAQIRNLNSNLKECIEYYFSLCEIVASIKKQVEKADIFELRHELLIDNPIDSLKTLCQFLGVEPYEDYLKDCAKIVYKTPHKSRFDIDWNSELIDMVQNSINEFSFLNGYSYES